MPLIDFLSFLQGIQLLLCFTVCFSAHQAPSKRRSPIKGKNFAHNGSKFFLFRIDPFQKRGKTIFDRVAL